MSRIATLPGNRETASPSPSGAVLIGRPREQPIGIRVAPAPSIHLRRVIPTLHLDADADALPCLAHVDYRGYHVRRSKT
jgi:hypothetical protein